MAIDCGGYGGADDDNAKADAAARLKTWRERDAALAAERWRYIVKSCAIWAQGHRLVTHGSHTGHAVQTVALCEDEHTAKALAESLAAYRQIESDVSTA